MRGQITVFILLGIVIMIMLGFFLFSPAKIAVESPRTLLDTLPAETQLKSCFDGAAEKAVYYFGTVGGDTDEFAFYYTFDPMYGIPYYYVKGKTYTPSIDASQTIMKHYVEQNFLKCANVTSPGFQAIVGKPNATVTIEREKVVIHMTYPVRLKAKDRILDLPARYVADIPARLYDMLFIAKTITDRAVRDDLLIHWDYLTDATTHDYNATAYIGGDESIVYRIVDLRNKLFHETPFTLQFAVKVKTVEK